MSKNMSFDPLLDLMDQTRSGSGQFRDSEGKFVKKEFNYHAPATERDFDDLASKGVVATAGLRQLLGLSDGFEIYNFEGVDGYRIFSTSELPAINESIGSSFGEQWNEQLLIFAECIGDGSYLAINRDRDDVIDCFLEADPSEWKVVSPSIPEFFAKLIKSNGQKFWLDGAR